MTIILPSMQRTPAAEDGFNAIGIRTLISKHLAVDIERVTDDAHFIEDLGADRFDFLELMIVIEDQFCGLEITDDDADRIQVVGDLIRYVETWVSRGQKR